MEKRRAAEDLVRYAWKLTVDSDDTQVLEALDYLDKAIELDPTHEYVWYWKGVALQRLKKWAKALECFEKSIVIDEGFPESWYHKGRCLQALDNARDSIEAFQMALLRFSDPHPRLRSNSSSESFRKFFGFSEIEGWKNKERSRKLYENRMVVPTINALAVSYGRLFYFDKCSNLLQKTEKILGDLGLPIPEELKKKCGDAKLMHDTLRNIGTNLEWRFPPGFPDAQESFSTDYPALHEALRLALACKYEGAFEILGKNVKPDSGVTIQLLFATFLLDSVPYRSDDALDRQGMTAEKRRLRLQEAEQILSRVLKKEEIRTDPLSLSIRGVALNNKAAAVIHLADYSKTWDEVLKRHQEAYETFRRVTHLDASLKSPKLNLAELNFCLRVLKQEPKKNPHFLKEFTEFGLGLTEIRDLLLVLRGTEVKIEMLEELMKTTKDQSVLSQLRQNIENLKKEQKKPRGTAEQSTPRRRSARARA